MTLLCISSVFQSKKLLGVIMNTKLAGLLLILLVVATVSACASTLPPSQVSVALPATPPGAASSAETPVPAATATQDETPTQQLVYRGQSIYRWRDYEIQYDPAQWQLILDPDQNPNTPGDQRLQNRQDVDCYVRLFSVAYDRTYTGVVELAGREWKVSPPDATAAPEMLASQFINYLTAVTNPDRKEVYYHYSFLIHLPLLPDEAARSRCQQAAETVIDTFVVTDSAVKWNEYTHPEWGLIFDYPSDWAVSIPDFEALAQRPDDLPEDLPYEPNLEYMRTLGHHISLQQSNADLPAAGIMIAVETFTISPGTDLQTWVDLLHELEAIENPLANETTVRAVEVTDLPFATVADQVVYDILENSHFQIATIWLAKGELVFILSTSDRPEARQMLEAVAASVRFVEARMAELRAKALFSGDENAIIDLITRLQPPPTVECDSICRDAKILDELLALNPPVSPLAPVSPLSPLVAPNPPLRLPTPTPAPRISPFPPGYYEQDPEVWDENGVYPPFSITYDPARWALVLPGNGNGGDRLENRLVLGCWLHIGYGPMDAYLVEEKQLGGHLWKIYRMPPDGNAFAYRINIAYEFGPVLPGNATEAERQQCIQMTEDVISTFQLLPPATPAPE